MIVWTFDCPVINKQKCLAYSLFNTSYYKDSNLLIFPFLGKIDNNTQDYLPYVLLFIFILYSSTLSK